MGIPPLWSVDILQRSGEAYTSLAPQRIAPAARRFVTAWDFLFPSCQSAGSSNIIVCVPTTVATPTVRAVERVSLNALATKLLIASIVSDRSSGIYFWLCLLREFVSLPPPGVYGVLMLLPIGSGAFFNFLLMPLIVGTTRPTLPFQQPQSTLNSRICCSSRCLHYITTIAYKNAIMSPHYIAQL